MDFLSLYNWTYFQACKIKTINIWVSCHLGSQTGSYDYSLAGQWLIISLSTGGMISGILRLEYSLIPASSSIGIQVTDRQIYL